MLAAEATRANGVSAEAAAPVNPGAATLPRTGTAVASLAAGAFALMMLGFALRRFRIRPTTH